MPRAKSPLSFPKEISASETILLVLGALSEWQRRKSSPFLDQSPSQPCPSLLLQDPALSSGIIHTLPVTLQCNLDNQWWVEKTAWLHSAVTQSDAFSLSDHWRGLLTLHQHNPPHQHFSLYVCVNVCECMCIHTCASVCVCVSSSVSGQKPE